MGPPAVRLSYLGAGQLETIGHIITEAGKRDAAAVRIEKCLPTIEQLAKDAQLARRFKDFKQRNAGRGRRVCTKALAKSGQHVREALGSSLVLDQGAKARAVRGPSHRDMARVPKWARGEWTAKHEHLLPDAETPELQHLIEKLRSFFNIRCHKEAITITQWVRNFDVNANATLSLPEFRIAIQSEVARRLERKLRGQQQQQQQQQQDEEEEEEEEEEEDQDGGLSTVPLSSRSRGSSGGATLRQRRPSAAYLRRDGHDNGNSNYLTTREIEMLFAYLDADGSGEVDIKEMQLALCGALPTARRELADSVFRSLEHGSGKDDSGGHVFGTVGINDLRRSLRIGAASHHDATAGA